MCFSDFVIEAEGKHDAGFGYIVLLIGNIAVHILVILSFIGKMTKLKIIRYYNKR